MLKPDDIYFTTQEPKTHEVGEYMPYILWEKLVFLSISSPSRLWLYLKRPPRIHGF
jgi:hypothetical protein